VDLFTIIKREVRECSCFAETVKNADEEAEYKLLEEKFIRSLPKNVRGSDLVRIIFKRHDQLSEEFKKVNTVACGAQCWSCCEQLVNCTSLEMELIHQHLQSLPRKAFQSIRKNLETERSLFMTAIGGMGMATRSERVFDALTKIFWGRRCIYLLKDKRCGIYPVRPVDCRTLRVGERCDPAKEMPEPLLIVADEVMAKAIEKEELESGTKPHLLPLIDWASRGKISEIFK
jgi:Fe-S-cluster containining protein